MPSDIESGLVVIQRVNQLRNSSEYKEQLEAGLWRLVALLAIAVPFGFVVVALCALLGLPAVEYVPVVATVALLGGFLVSGFCAALKTVGGTLNE